MPARSGWLNSRRKHTVAALSLAGVLVLELMIVFRNVVGETAKPPLPSSQAPSRVAKKVGLLTREGRAFEGYTLLAPLYSTDTYLIDMQGRVVRTWKSDCTPALSAYLLENGHLLRPGRHPGGTQFLDGPAAGGHVQEFDWDGRLVWDYAIQSESRRAHHDVVKMPNGNVLMIVWERKSREEAIVAGRDPKNLQYDLLADSLIEVKPTGKATGQIVWEWHVWDHLVQDHDRSKANFGNVANHAERVDINFGGETSLNMDNDDVVEKLRSIGYVGSSSQIRKTRNQFDWTHVNSVAYNAELDQVMLSVHSFSEIWILDHSTTTAEASGHTGGRSGHGGDLLYRWGNRLAYRGDGTQGPTLFGQHDAHWIPSGVSGAGHLLVFNNGRTRPSGPYSSVDEIVLPVDSRGRYDHRSGHAFGPESACWSYRAPRHGDFYSGLISGAQRLPNGNTLICSGEDGTLFEVTSTDAITWKYVNPTRTSVHAKLPGNAVFRAYRYAPTYAGLAGRVLTPGSTVEKLVEVEANSKKLAKRDGWRNIKGR